MNRIVHIVCASVVVISSGLKAETWTSNTGHNFEGSFVSFTPRTQTVVLKSEESEEHVSLNMAVLTAASRENVMSSWAESLPKYTVTGSVRAIIPHHTETNYTGDFWIEFVSVIDGEPVGKPVERKIKLKVDQKVHGFIGDFSEETIPLDPDVELRVRIKAKVDFNKKGMKIHELEKSIRKPDLKDGQINLGTVSLKFNRADF